MTDHIDQGNVFPTEPQCEAAHWYLVLTYRLKCSRQTGNGCHRVCCWHMLSLFLGMWGVLVFAICDAMCDIIFQDERHEEHEGTEERILCSNFSPGRNVEVFELPDSEVLFMPGNMDSSQMAFKFKEVSPTSDYQSFNLCWDNNDSIKYRNGCNHIYFPSFVV